MRELTVRLRFTKESLGNVKAKDGSGRYLMPRTNGQIVFLATWHQANMRFAAQLLGRHQNEVGKIRWNILTDAVVRQNYWYRCYYSNSAGKRRYTQHEAFLPGQVIGINCVVPSTISDDDFWQLLRLAGQYKGLSPWKPGEHGFFDIESIRLRRVPCDAAPETKVRMEETCEPSPLVGP